MTRLTKNAVPVWRLAALAIAFACAIACAAIAVLCVAPGNAQAADKEATLTLVVLHEEKGVKRHISGAEFTAYQVARIGAGNRYELVEPFTGADVDFNSSLTARQSAAAANDMASTAAKKKVKGKKVTTNTQGKAAFGTMDMGVYLLVQTGAKDVAAKYKTMSPFLVNVPQMEGGEVTYDVVAYPKPEPIPATNPPKKTPKTGDSLDWGMVTLAAIAGMCAMLLALFAARKRRSE